MGHILLIHGWGGVLCKCFAFIFLQEVFYLTYTPDDVEGNQQLETGDKVSFYMETNKQWVLSY